MKTLTTFMNEVIPASAGTGKTFMLTDKFIELMDQGVMPEKIVALTFTKKASGEFFDGILEKLANSSNHDPNSGPISKITGVSEFNNKKALRLLRLFINSMPSLEMGTIDSFLYKMVSSIPFEMGITGDFEILTEHEIQLARENVLRRIYDGEKYESAMFLNSLKNFSYGKENSGVEAALSKYLDKIHNKFIYNFDEVFWGNESLIWPEETWVELDKKALDSKIQRIREINESLEIEEEILIELEPFLLWIIETTEGKAPKECEKVVKKIIDKISEIKAGDAKIKFNRSTYEISGELAEHFSHVTSHLIAITLKAQLLRTQGLWKVLKAYDDQYSQTVRQRGRLTFSDFPYFLSRKSELGSNYIDMIQYRMDAKYDHWLLDEFQDTSREQWDAIENLVDECAMDPEAARSSFIVGDIKQSIYSWRGGDSRIFNEQKIKYQYLGPERFKETSLDKSRRSSLAVIETVNSIFGNRDELFKSFPCISDRWEFENHTTVHEKRPGYTSWVSAENEGKSNIKNKLPLILETINEINPLKNNLSVGILVQKNDTAGKITKFLRQCTNLKVSNDTNVYIAKDNAVGAALLSIFRLASHPGDNFSLGHLMMTPFQEFIDGNFPNIESFGIFIRSSIWKKQFTETVRRLVSNLNLDEFNSMRTEQFLEASSIFDKTGNRSIDEFVRFMENHYIRETGDQGPVEVMTIHKSKGLTFDAVILPDLGGTTYLSTRLETEIKYNQSNNPEWIFTMPNKSIVESDSTLKKYRDEKVANDVYEKICKFYVAMTRARYANYLITEENEGKSPNFVNLLDKTIKENEENIGMLYSNGDPEWFNKTDQKEPTPPIKKSEIPLVSENLRRKTYSQVSNSVSETLSSKEVFETNFEDID